MNGPWAVSNCAIHDLKEYYDGDSYLLCFECGHVFETEQQLVEEDFAFRSELYPGEVIERTKADEIYSCPLCTHDF